ncbi:MAG TPA: hypothetical protein VG125_05005 [Pirellulales bacterium]|nr:hypothetical protein [Pirellulales bacterium]
MNLDYVPLLHLQRQLYDMPRGRDRFREYLRTMRNDDGSGLDLPPLVTMNPMAREHVPAMLDELLAIDADGIGARAVAEAASDLAPAPGDYKVGLVVADDLKGGWTNRYASEFKIRFPELSVSPDGIQPPTPKWSQHTWLTGVLWSSEPVSPRAVREAVLTAVYRAAYLQQHGHARTLSDRLVQEGWVMAKAGCTEPALDDEELAYTREVIAPFLEADDLRTTVECLFGDVAARSLGFTPRGLSPSAGLALALDGARRPNVSTT